MKVSIVIPYWNGVEKIKKHLPEVLKFAKANNVLEVIASDDASTDGTAELLRNEFPDVVVAERNKNEGFASNVNTGFSKTSGEYVFLLNSDAHPGEGVLKYGLPHFEDPKVFSVGCNAGGLWAVGEFKDGFFWHKMGVKDSDNQGDKGNQGNKGDTRGGAHKTLWVSGGSGIFRKSIWDELKGMDHLYNPFYVEDIDLGYRAWKRGYINLWEPRSEVEHYREKGVIESNFDKSIILNTSERNMLIFTWKNITSKKLTSDHQKALIKRLIQHPKYMLIFIKAAKKFPEIMAKRKIEKDQSKLTDEEVLHIFQNV